jgi:UDP-glucose 4-epimerase
VTWLLTGGAGYIGAHVAAELVRSGRPVVVVDDLSGGQAERVPAGVPLVVCSVLDTRALARTMTTYGVRGVVHLAAKKSVTESVRKPLYYYDQNVRGTASVLAAMRRTGAHRLVLSSSAAVYGSPPGGPIAEATTTLPINPYGSTKLLAEWLLDAASARSEFSWIALRYFNVIGAGSAELGDPGVSNLLQGVLRALTAGERPHVFGADQPTPDGTCVRDFVHVADLAAAHLAAVDRLETDAAASACHYNVGRGVGVSVFDVLSVVREVTGVDPGHIVTSPRQGDPPCVIADPSRIRAALGWSATSDLQAMVGSAWDAWRWRWADRPPATQNVLTHREIAEVSGDAG